MVRGSDFLCTVFVTESMECCTSHKHGHDNALMFIVNVITSSFYCSEER